MKIALMSNGGSVHTVRWANGLSSRGLEVHVISVHEPSHAYNKAVRVHVLRSRARWGYVGAARQARRLLHLLRPDVLNAHYATGYGLLARLIGFAPYLLSVWGSDVYDFPERSLIHRVLLRGNLRAATLVASTSHCMARRVREISPMEKIAITPFGVDERKFVPKFNSGQSHNEVVIGTVKTLAPTYGIDTLIDAFSGLLHGHAEGRSLALEITGGGPGHDKLRALAQARGVSAVTTFHEQISHSRVPAALARLDIFVALSRQESFGVAAIEAAMCGLPVVVSDAEGLAEVVEDGVTGIVVPKNDKEAAIDALSKLVRAPSLREKMGRAGRERALANYTWEKSLDIMIETYKRTIVLASAA